MRGVWFVAALSVAALLSAGALAKGAKHPAPGVEKPLVIKDCRDCPEMVAVPAGEFMMGSPTTEKQRGPETQHVVTILRAFAVSKFEITFAQWDACVKDGGCDGYRPEAPWGRGRMPVVNINFRNAEAYAAWLSRKTGKRYRLLSEAEWEWAARGGSRDAFAFGPTLSGAQANFDASSKTELNPEGPMRNKAVPVGAFRPNGFGLYDMHGNVWEWTEDCWNDEYGPALPRDGKPATTGDCAGRVLRGGSWEDAASDLRAAARVASAAGDRSWSDGISVAREL
ncbi:MAG: formylglycine-generating enzyme family protein [Caulobacteraceae bacterium]